MKPGEEALFLQYQKAMLRRAMQYVHNVHDAEDIVSGAWVSLISHLPTMMALDEKALSAYIMKCVANKALDYLKKKRHSPHEVELNDRIPAHINLADSTVLAKDFLEEILQVLTKQQQRVLMLKLEGYDDKDIAIIMCVRHSTIRGHWSQAKKRIYHMLSSGESV